VFTHRKHDKITLNINGQDIKIENSAKFLGLTFDSKLSWSAHIKYIEDKCKKRLNLMRAVSGNTWGASKKTLLTIYRALIRSIIDYGAIAYNTATESVKHRLDIIQQKALRIACGSFCTTAASALQVETGEPPLLVRRTEQELKYAIKIRATASHPAKPITEFHWTTLSRKFKDHNLPFYNKTLEYLTDTKQHNIKEPKLPEKPPWHQKPCITDSSLTNGVKKDENPELLKSLALAKIESYSNSVHIYTDASKTADNKTAAAYCIPKISIENSFRLNNNITIFTAELMALKLALLWVTNTLDEDVTIFSDSLSSLQALSTGKTDCRPNLLQEIKELVSTYNKLITFVWIPSHIGIRGNETADKLANRATQNTEIDLDIGLELAEAYTLVENYTLQKWQNLWTNGTTGSHYRQIQKTVSKK